MAATIGAVAGGWLALALARVPKVVQWCDVGVMSIGTWFLLPQLC